MTAEADMPTKAVTPANATPRMNFKKKVPVALIYQALVAIKIGVFTAEWSGWIDRVAMESAHGPRQIPTQVQRRRLRPTRSEMNEALRSAVCVPARSKPRERVACPLRCATGDASPNRQTYNERLVPMGKAQAFVCAPPAERNHSYTP